MDFGAPYANQSSTPLRVADAKLHFGAVALCSYTTVIGYGSLLFADNQALRSFGRLATSGEIACATAALVFLPSLLNLVGPARTRPLEPGR